MILFLKPVKDGPLDINLQAGDIVFAREDTAPIGGQEVKSWLALKIDDPVNSVGAPFPPATQAAIRDDLQRQEFSPGPTPDANLIRRERKHAIHTYRSRFSQIELAIIDDATQTLPDGPTAFGGTVAAGVVSGLFTFADLQRK